MAIKKVKTKRTKLLGWKKDGSDFLYYFKDSVSKRFNIKKIIFKGYKTLPVGFNLYKTGGGFNRKLSNKVGGDYFLTFLKTKYNKLIILTVFMSGSAASALRVQKRVLTLSIESESFKNILKDLGDEIKEKRDDVVRGRLAKYFPNEFPELVLEKPKANKRLSEINLNQLDADDHNSIGDFIKSYISLNAENDEVLAQLQIDLVIQGRKKTLNQVIKKFERHLNDKNFDEKKWQKFLHEDVFFFISNYIESIREANVNFGKNDHGEKKPDFVWIDIYGFLDVFEIKTPFTSILGKRIDTSHKNYYFSNHAAKAISQIEKYILFLEKNVENFENYLSKKTKIPFSVLKPKAFLIIGNSKEFGSNDDKRRDFRVLRRLFKNIEFITFDELLDNLKNLANKFEKVAPRKPNP